MAAKHQVKANANDPESSDDGTFHSALSGLSATPREEATRANANENERPPPRSPAVWPSPQPVPLQANRKNESPGQHRVRDLVSPLITMPKLMTMASASASWTTVPSRSRSRSRSASRSDDVQLVLSCAFEHFQFPPQLQNPVHASRRYRVVQKLGHGSYGNVFLAWDERRMYVTRILNA